MRDLQIVGGEDAASKQYIINCVGALTERPAIRISMQVAVQFKNSAQDALKVMERARQAMPVSPAAEPKGLGDKAYLFQDLSEHEDPRRTSGTMLFTVGSIYVFMAGEPGKELLLLSKEIEQLIIQDKTAQPSLPPATAN